MSRFQIAFLLFVFVFSSSSFAKEPDFQFQSDRKKTGISNLTTVESSGSYMARKVEEMQKEIEELKKAFGEAKENEKNTSSDGKEVKTLWSRLIQLEQTVENFDFRLEDIEVVNERLDEIDQILSSDRFVLKTDYLLHLENEK